MKTLSGSLFALLFLLVTGTAQAASGGQHTGFGYYGSVTWQTSYNNSTGGWNTVTEEVGPYLTYHGCYTAWTELAHSTGNGFPISASGCALRGTNSPYVEVSMAVDFLGGDVDDGSPIIDIDNVIRLSEEILRLRREFNIDAYERALLNIR